MKFPAPPVQPLSPCSGKQHGGVPAKQRPAVIGSFLAVFEAFRRLLVGRCDVLFEFTLFDPPLAAATNLDGRQFSTAHQCIRLGRGNVQDLADIGQREEPGHLLHLLSA